MIDAIANKLESADPAGSWPEKGSLYGINLEPVEREAILHALRECGSAAERIADAIESQQSRLDEGGHEFYTMIIGGPALKAVTHALRIAQLKTLVAA
mgnify:CR=1 FL=1